MYTSNFFFFFTLSHSIVNYAFLYCTVRKSKPTHTGPASDSIWEPQAFAGKGQFLILKKREITAYLMTE